jgi:hypothetical protein
MYSVLGSAAADVSAPLMIAATCSRLRGSKLRCRGRFVVAVDLVQRGRVRFGQFAQHHHGT